MNIEKYKIELESAIYEGADGEMFIGGKMVEKVLNDYHNDQLNLPPVSNNEVAVCRFTGICQYKGLGTIPKCNANYKCQWRQTDC